MANIPEILITGGDDPGDAGQTYRSSMVSMASQVSAISNLGIPRISTASVSLQAPSPKKSALRTIGSVASVNAELTPDKSAALLPADRDEFRHVRFFELKDQTVKASDVHSPRIRQGPSHPVKLPGTVYDGPKAASKPVNQSAGVTDWENVEEVNLSYQSLGDTYQHEAFMKTMHKLMRCKRLILMHNSLASLGGVHLKVCGFINLTGNCIAHFKVSLSCHVGVYMLTFLPRTFRTHRGCIP